MVMWLQSMKRKISPAEPVIDKALLEQAKLSVMTDQIKRADKCTVCGAECAPNSAEGLCWVCRRLKISAWRDSDQQSLQE
jgi:methionyl-tRNA synthetase